MKIKKEARNLVLFMTFGDGYLSSKGYLAIRHCVKQKEYLEWKKHLLNKAGIKTTDIYYVDNNGYGAYELRTKTYSFMKQMRNYLYCPKKTIANRKQLNKLTPIGLAIWYMDDGSLSLRKRDGRCIGNIFTLCTSLSKQENQIIIDYFNQVWGVSFGQRKMKGKYVLSCSTKMAQKFINIVRDYVLQVPCLEYKVTNLLYTFYHRNQKEESRVSFK